MSKHSALLAAILLLAAGRLSAQVVSIDDPVMMPLPDYPADQVATFRSQKAPAYPDRWKTDRRPHYAAVGLLIDPKGVPQKVDVDCEHAADADVRETAKSWRFHPALLHGKPVKAACRVFVCFNPVAPNDPAPDAPVTILSGSFTPTLAAMDGFPTSLFFHTKFTVDEAGLAQDIEVTPAPSPQLTNPQMIAAYQNAEVSGAVKTMLQHWKFAPARVQGHPVAHPLSIGVWATNDRLLDSQFPVPIKQPHPEYPYSLRKSGNRGEVMIRFTVDKYGKVQNPSVVKSTHPDFEAPAITALLHWKFTPGTMMGVPVSMEMMVPIIFQLEYGGSDQFSSLEPNSNGAPTFEVPGSSNKKVPAEYRYDTPPQTKVIVLPVYPFEQLKRDVSGSAEIVMLVDANGKVIQTGIKKASSPEFGSAAEAAALCWEFEPAMLNGKPTKTILGHTFEFDLSNRDFSLDDDAEDLLDRVRKKPESIVKLKDLDRIPQATYRVRPKYLPGSPSGGVEVELYLDKKGQVRFPHMVSCTNDILVGPSLTALARWHFEPPLKGGKPVDAVARIPLSYTVPSVAGK